LYKIKKKKLWKIALVVILVLAVIFVDMVSGSAEGNPFERKEKKI